MSVHINRAFKYSLFSEDKSLDWHTHHCINLHSPGYKILILYTEKNLPYKNTIKLIVFVNISIY